MIEASLENRARAQGIKMTAQRAVVCSVLDGIDDHPDALQIHDKARQIDPRIALATVYRTMRLLEDRDLIKSHNFGDGRSRYEDGLKDEHGHLINSDTGEVIEFHDAEFENLKKRIAKRLGYDVTGHRLELYGKPLG
ncbi:MAG: Fur family transcriptional regulator [Sphingomonadales bacterium]